jgi:eukaryotic-like serine/threonine-protein kinase
MPGNAPGGPCPPCVARQALTAHTPGRAGVGATTSPAANFSGRSPETGPNDSDPTRAHTAKPVTDAASPRTDSAGNWASDRTENHDGNPAPRDLLRDVTIRHFGDYEILKELGRGGMGVVYKARQISLNRPVALKMIKAGVLADEAELRRFQNEANAVALLDHPGIVPVYEVDEHDGEKYFSMKLVEGSNLAEQLASFQDNFSAAAALMIEATEAVQHAHMRGILHRDLKPANILLDTHGRPHITDFGLAKMMESDVELTASGAIMGTPAYMSPEQAAGRRRSMTLATDVYGLGAILYAMLTGKAPFDGDSIIETLDAVRTRPPEPPRKRNARIPRDLELICLKCLEKNPADRYPTAAALADDLRCWAADEPVSVRAAGNVERLAKWARRKPTLAAAYTLGILTVVLGGLGGAAVWQWRAAVRARDLAASAKMAAEEARDGEAMARATVQKAHDELATAREALAAVEYGRTMEIALQAWRENHVVTTLSLLSATRSDLRGWEWRYVDRLCHLDLLTLKGHTDGVSSAAFSPDGSRIVTASDDNTANVWDARSGALALTLRGHAPGDLKSGVLSASFSPDGARIVTASYDKTAKVWDARSGAELITLNGHTSEISSARFSPDGARIVTASADSTSKVWDAQSGAMVLTLKGHTGGVTSVSFSPDGARIVTASEDNTAKVWDARSGALALTLGGHTGRVTSVSFSPDGFRIVTASGDNSAKVWDARSGALALTLKGHTSGEFMAGILSASFSPDGSRIVTGGADATAKVWDALSGAEILTLKGHTAWISSASFSPDGARIVTASEDYTAKVWDARSGGERLTMKGHTSKISSARFSADGARIVTASEDNTVKVWEVRSGDEILTLKGHTAGVTSASFSPDGSRIVTGSVDETAKVWDARSGAPILTLRGHTDVVRSASYSPDGQRIVTASEDETAKVWDARSGAEILTLKGHSAGVVSLNVPSVEVPFEGVNSAGFSPDGSQIVTGSGDQTAKVWDARGGALVRTLTGHTSWISSASFSPDGARIVTTSYDQTAKLWDARSGALVRTLTGHTSWISSASFSPDGARIVTTSGDNTVKLWDAKSGALVLTLKGPTVSVTCVSFSPDGSRIVTGSVDGTANVWDATPINRKLLPMELAPPPAAVK